VAPGPAQAAADQAHISQQLAVIGAHQPQAPQCPSQTAQGIAGIEDLEGMLQGVAAAAIDGGVDLDVAPGKHQQGGAELVNRLAQRRLAIEGGQGRQIEELLLQARELFVQVVGQIDGPHRKDGIAGQAHQQQPLVAGGRQGPGVWLGRGGEPGRGLGWEQGFSQGSRPYQAGTLTRLPPLALRAGWAPSGTQ